MLGYANFSPFHNYTGAINYLLSITSTFQILRAVAISTPTLWVAIAYRPRLVYEENDDDPGDLRTVPRIRAYVERSHNVSLELFFSFGRLTRGATGVIDVVLPYLQRCKTIRLDFRSAEYEETLSRRLFPLPSPMSRLTELQVGVYSTYTPLEPLRLFEPSNASPLSSLRIYGQGKVDVSHLASTGLSDFLVNKVVSLIPSQEELWARHATTLTSLTTVNFHHMPKALPVIELPNLKSLAIIPQLLGQLPLSLYCPNLEDLTLCQPPSFGRRKLDSHSVPASPPWPKLRTLRLRISFKVITQYATVLAVVPSVTHVVCYSAAAEYVIICLADNPQVAPRLAVLQLFMLPAAMIPNRLTQLWESRPLLRIECAREGVGLSQDTLDTLGNAYPDRFVEVDGNSEPLDRLYRIA